MTGVAAEQDVDRALAQLDDALTTLTGTELYRLGDEKVLEVLRRVEAHRRRLPVVDHLLVGEVEHRRLAERHCVRSTAMLLREVLRVSAREATGRVRAAERLGVREQVTGDVLPPLFPIAAAAQAAGELSAEQARVITSTVEDLPDGVQQEHHAAIERTLVAEARNFDPDTLSKLGRRIVSTVDPDGTLPDDREHDRRRGGTLTVHRDGSGDLRVHFTPEAVAIVQAVVLPLAKPRPSGDGGRDERTAGQRLHDAILDMARRLLSSGTLPTTGGTPATVLLTMTLEQLESRTGLVTTGHGGQLTVNQALRLAGEADVIPVVIDTDGVLGYGRTRRTASATQRRALAARDGGCVMAGCDYPPDWCEVHHTIRWEDGGTTDLDHLVLLCGFHHDHHEAQGWQIVMREGQA
ncbi:MAG: DUF222 domain-containing protein, partial [Jatrophihabitans sp.]